MFKVYNTKLNIFGREVATVEGTKTYYVDDELNISSSGTPVCTVEVTNGKITSISSPLPQESMGGEQILKGRYRHARRQIALCPIMDGPTLDTHLAGFAFDYNYTNIGYVATQVVPYMFIGGRICSNPQPWTCLPSGMSCAGTPTPSFYSSIGMLGGGRSDINWLNNAISFAFTYRSGRKYFYFKRGYKGIFTCGTLKGGDL